MSIKVTKEFIQDNTNGGCVNKAQSVILGIDNIYEQKGWIESSYGKVISDASAELFKRLKGLNGGLQQIEIDKFKSERSRVQHSLF